MVDERAELVHRLEVCAQLLQRLEREVPRREHVIMALLNVQAAAQSQLDALSTRLE